MPDYQDNLPQRVARQSIDELVREHWGKLLACLISQIGDFQLAEDSLQDGLESAFIHWQRDGLPRLPQAWLLQTARRKAIDRLRRTANFNSKKPEYQYLLALDQSAAETEEAAEIPDERLRLIFTCCHPALDEKSRTALTLKILGGLKTREIARAFLDTEEAMAQRLVRAKRKIKGAAIPYKVPDPEEWSQRLGTVLSVVYLIFNEGYFSAHGASQIRIQLCNEALRLTELLQILIPDEPEIAGLNALIYLNLARISARYNEENNLVSLEYQDRDKWNQVQIAKGCAILEHAMTKSESGPYQIQAAISAIHSEAASHDSTNWHQIVLLYDALFDHRPNPVIKLNRAVALSFSNSPQEALDQVIDLENELSNYQPFHAAKADFYRRVGDIANAEKYYCSAMDLSSEPDTRAFLGRKLGQMLAQ